MLPQLQEKNAWKSFIQRKAPSVLRETGNWFFRILWITFYLIPINAFNNLFLISSIKDGTLRKKIKKQEFRHAAAEKDATHYCFCYLQVIHSNPLMKSPHNSLKGWVTVNIKGAYVISLWVDVISFYCKAFSKERICQIWLANSCLSTQEDINCLATGTDKLVQLILQVFFTKYNLTNFRCRGTGPFLWGPFLCHSW